MKFFLLKIGIIIIFCFACKAQKNEASVINMEMPGGSLTRIRYTNTNYELTPITFRNEKQSTTVIEKIVNITKPTFFRYNLLNGAEKFVHQFLIFPGDTINLKFESSGDIYEKKIANKKLFIEFFINIDYKKENLNVSTDESQINQIRLENEEKLDNKLNLKIISKEEYDALKLFSDIRYYIASTSSIYTKSNESNEKLKFIFDEIEDRFQEFKAISAFDVFSLYENLITFKYNAQSEKTLNKFIEIIIANNQGDLSKALIKSKIEQHNDKNSIDYFNAINYLNTLGLEYEKINFVPKDILELPLFSEYGKSKTLQDELTILPENGLIVLDLWASWCVPCVYEFPFTKKHKEGLEKSNIIIVPISIDVDKDGNNWLEMSKKYSYLFEIKNYRLLDKDKKKFTNFFKVTTIPRYIVISKKAMIIDKDFINPSNPSFPKNLLNYQIKYKN